MADHIPNDQRAFPSAYLLLENVGLTKRELFAAMAMQGFLANPKAWDDGSPEGCASASVAYADALLTALKETP